MKAAGPVPGSIGSAISGPGLMSGAGASSDQMARTPNVPFNDPAMQFNMSSSASGAVGSGKKKSSRTTLIILIVIAFLVVAALAVVLAMQLMGGNGSNGGSTSSSNSSNSSSSTDSGAKPQSNSSDSSSGGGSSQATDSTSTTLSCVRNMTTAEVVSFKDAVSGTVSVSAEFSKNNLLSSVSLVKSVVYSDEDSASNEPVEMEVHESEAKDITSSSAVIFDLPVDSSTGEVNLTLSAIQANYGDLAFTCKVL